MVQLEVLSEKVVMVDYW